MSQKEQLILVNSSVTKFPTEFNSGTKSVKLNISTLQSMNYIKQTKKNMEYIFQYGISKLD